MGGPRFANAAKNGAGAPHGLSQNQALTSPSMTEENRLATLTFTA